MTSKTKKPIHVTIMNQLDFITGVVCLFLGTLIRFLIIPLTIKNNEISIVNNAQFFSDASFVPKIWAVLIMIFSALVILESIKFKEKAEVQIERVDVRAFKESAMYSLLLLALMSAYVYLLSIIGFVLDSVVFVSVALYLFGYRKIIGGAIIVLSTTLIVYFVWVKFLYVTFPYPLFPFPLS
jgi:putative tricarboxylic transport membrane protein